MQTHFRSHTCGELRITDIGTEVTLAGWVQGTRDLGYLLFLDLRDRYGITQVSVKSQELPDLYEKAKSLGREFVIQVKGTVLERESKNAKIPTGEIEIVPTSIEVLNPAKLPAFFD